MLVQKNKRIGFIGLGNMGLPMSKNLLKAGYQVVAYDIDNAAMEEVAKFGAEKGLSPKDVAQRCLTVITMLVNSKIVEQVVFGADGLLEGMGNNSLLIDMGSSDPSSTRKIHKALGEKNARMIDAPVSGGKKGAIDGTLSIMVGGDEAVYKECVPLLETFGKSVNYIGEIGSGHALKSINNFLSALAFIGTAEAMAVAVKAGLDPEVALNVIAASTGRNGAVEDKFPKQILTGKFNLGSALDIYVKDLGIFNRLAEETKIPVLFAKMAQEYIHMLTKNPVYNRDTTGIVKYIEDICDVKIRSSKH